MSIAIKPTAANQVRALAQSGLTVADIRKLTGFPLPTIKAALEHKGYDRVKSRAEPTQ